MDTVEKRIDAGVAYGQPAGKHDAALVEVGQGTPMGELLRRYWIPIAKASDATETPKRIKALAEDLILFRDKAGRPGLLQAACCHRGTTLYYGRVEEQGIRCCYHGWLYDVEGRCLDQPCEVGRGQHRENFRQPWYPVEERYGLIFAYMGPPEKKPVLPRYDALEELGPGEFIEPDQRGFGPGGPTVVPCNWLQYVENVMDAYHVPILHGLFSMQHFVPEMTVMPEVEDDYTAQGTKTTTLRRLEDGRVFRRVVEVMIPTARAVPDSFVKTLGRAIAIDWTLPCDDTSFTVFRATRVKQAGDGLLKRREYVGGKSWDEMTEEEHQWCPNDYEAQTGQGAIAKHSLEHLAGSDRGVVMLRRVLRQQVAIVAEGGDPMGVKFTEAEAMVRLDAGNFMLNSGGEASST